MTLADDQLDAATLRARVAETRVRDLPAVVARPTGERKLRLVLVGLDAGALLAGWFLAFIVFPVQVDTATSTSLGLTVTLTVFGLWILHIHDLYLARTSSVRAIEVSRLFRSCAILAVAGLAITSLLRIDHTAREIMREIIIGAAFSFVFLVVLRSAYRAWMTAARERGEYIRDVVLVGTNEDAADLLELLADHPDLGMRVVAVLGQRAEAMERGMAALYGGTAAMTMDVLAKQGATGAVIATGGIEQTQLNELVRDLQSAKVEIHLSSGVRGIDYRRLRPLPLAHEPLFYLEPPVLSRWQLFFKRVIDLTMGLLGLIVSLPITVLVAILIKVHDRGPVFFKQVRVGRDGELFTVFKFRTMVVDAEAKLAALMEQNERAGPLFKMENDPRVTRLGRFLRDSSLDEVPQLWNVIKGEMSLVGPRPALPAEVEAFDDELLARTKVKPGITGLWQVEARDNPSFKAYRRFDLFYVDNWSVGLDLVILLATAEQVIARAIKSIVGRGESIDDEYSAPEGLAAAGGSGTDEA